ncbi:MAG: hypothetical protein PHW95_04225 [Patescibacteria group bacterium]|nr:hypothetical protein [Patescibacteria group bacterium]
MATEAEIQKTFKISLEDDNLIVVELLGNVSTAADNVKQAQIINQTFQNIYHNVENSAFKTLIIMSGLGGGAHYPSPQARQIYLDLLRNEKLKKLAIVAPSPLLRAIMKFIISGRVKDKPLEFFNSRDQAITWLNSEITEE